MELLKLIGCEFIMCSTPVLKIRCIAAILPVG